MMSQSWGPQGGCGGLDALPLSAAGATRLLSQLHARNAADAGFREIVGAHAALQERARVLSSALATAQR